MNYSVELIVEILKEKYNPANIAGMARFGISSNNTLGVPMPVLRSLAKEIKKDHQLALGLWQTGIHEARILAALIDDWRLVDAAQMERWVKDFDSWDVCDQCCMNLFDKAKDAYQKAIEWTSREEEFVKRAGYVLMATMSVHLKKTDNEYFLSFFPYLLSGASDERNFVRKAVNWAIRQIGKRNIELNACALELCREILQTYSSAKSRWIAKDAEKELLIKRELLLNGRLKSKGEDS